MFDRIIDALLIVICSCIGLIIALRVLLAMIFDRGSAPLVSFDPRKLAKALEIFLADLESRQQSEYVPEVLALLEKAYEGEVMGSEDLPHFWVVANRGLWLNKRHNGMISIEVGKRYIIHLRRTVSQEQ